MKLLVTVDGQEDRIEILQPAPDCRFAMGDGVERAADVDIPEPGAYSILLDGRSYEARVEESARGLTVTVGGYNFDVEVRDPRRLSRKPGRGGADGVQMVFAPMPGKVVRVLVAPGQAIEAGQGVIVVEAMKMQNEMKAAKAGTVRAVAVKEGATVTAGQVLAEIE